MIDVPTRIANKIKSLIETSLSDSKYGDDLSLIEVNVAFDYSASVTFCIKRYISPDHDVEMSDFVKPFKDSEAIFVDPLINAGMVDAITRRTSWVGTKSMDAMLHTFWNFHLNIKQSSIDPIKADIVLAVIPFHSIPGSEFDHVPVIIDANIEDPTMLNAAKEGATKLARELAKISFSNPSVFDLYDAAHKLWKTMSMPKRIIGSDIMLTVSNNGGWHPVFVMTGVKG